MERGVSSLLVVVPRVAGQDPTSVHFAQNHDRSPIPEKRDQHDVIASYVMHITSLF